MLGEKHGQILFDIVSFSAENSSTWSLDSNWWISLLRGDKDHTSKSWSAATHSKLIPISIAIRKPTRHHPLLKIHHRLPQCMNK
ncbi:GM26839 [Drosophila sechellia]|uniref:GD19288 n=2 Tax=melanogaster subgroup TaxID=32351 RepID=B4QTD7_DROSI|nr:GM26839 [Drosophila sechellia]EDX12339.1 GD19288 [Drosophila simulans]